MYVQPYFPEQIEIPGNIASEAYDTRLSFIRRTVALHLVSAALVASVTLWLPSPLGPTLTLWTWLSLLVALSATRLVAHRGKADLIVSSMILPAMLLALGWTIRWALDLGWPVWSLGLPLAGVAFYTLACGRDFSFIGLWMLSAVLIVGTVSVVAWLTHPGLLSSVNAATFALAYLSYYVYDLAALLTRRRRGEEIGAVVDLYRDVLNFTTYTGRIVQHWRKFRI